MAGIDPVVSLTNANASSAPQKTPSADLGQIDFMKLIIAQMQNQNPLEPQSNTDFMAQMAQFEGLNQSKAMSAGIRVLQSISELTTASGMIGKEVIGKQVAAIGITRDIVGRDLFSAPFDKLTSAQKVQVNQDQRVIAAAGDAQNAGMEASGRVDRVVVGPDGVPMLMIGTKVVDLFTVSEVK
ncbi:hypothetical protein AYO38_02875 [bacterium SCGC AG-212-C10]|nr:hypothetical protein AYO38_02875 [bacterium SCGC AG-212-C10]